MEQLYCSKNQLTSLDVSKCTALNGLDCRENQLNAAALNKIFTDLPVIENNGFGRGSIRIRNNPGVETCDKSIAEKKRWNVYYDY